MPRRLRHQKTNVDVNGLVGKVPIVPICKSHISKTFLLNVFEDDEANDYDDDVVMEVVHHLLRGKKRRQRIADYFGETVPAYAPEEFSSHFRMRRETFEEVCRQVLFQNDHFVFIK